VPQQYTVHEEVPMKTIHVPLDGSALSDQVLPYVAYMAGKLGARVQLLRVVPDAPSEAQIPQEVAAVDMAAAGVFVPQPIRPPAMTLRRHAEGDHLSSLLALRAHGLEAELEVEIGQPAELILEAARSASMIAMTTHGYSGVRRWTLGSVTDKVIQAATAPVFVAQSAAETSLAERPPTLRRILLPLDGSALSRQAVATATELAVAAGAQLLLLRALPLVVPIDQPQLIRADSWARNAGTSYLEASTQAFAELQALADELHERHGVVVACNVRPGHAADTIIEEAECQGADLVVMATHGYGGLRRWALGSVADRVLHASRIPLMLVRARDF
jgi:nucleotide-binding universal stress UspA family protein